MKRQDATQAIAVDAMGADMGPEEVVAGVALALKNGWAPDKVIIVGQEQVVEEAMRANGLEGNPRAESFAASEVIEMHEKPVQSLRTKKDSSLVRTVELVKLGSCAAAVSCGNTGSLMACSTLKLRPVEGVSKPALASVWPSLNHKFIVLDVGANPQCRPENLLHYAILGHQYARDALSIEKPRIGILSIGTEEGKGTDLTDRAHQLLKGLGDQINYIGLIEGFQLFNNEVDVVVTDGFTGNVILKTCESLWGMLKGLIGEEIRRNPLRMAGALLLRGGLKSARNRLDPKKHGGAPLLGLRGTVLKAHGSSNREAIANAIRIAGVAIRHDLSGHTVKAIANANSTLGDELSKSG
ncbi:MAG TPA: phosphate acyltransferase PlsX [Oceanipulchritudo sp.]|nr:phosphate acyltransferase PlsX [Oceanipulchritudo sp.]